MAAVVPLANRSSSSTRPPSTAPAPIVESTIRPRSPRFDFAAVPNHWFAGSVIGTAFANGLNLLFPAGERFFVRSVRRYLDELEKAGLLEIEQRGLGKTNLYRLFLTVQKLGAKPQKGGRR